MIPFDILNGTCVQLTTTMLQLSESPIFEYWDKNKKLTLTTLYKSIQITKQDIPLKCYITKLWSVNEEFYTQQTQVRCVDSSIYYEHGDKIYATFYLTWDLWPQSKINNLETIFLNIESQI